MKPPYNQKENTMDELSALAQEVRAMLKNRDSLPDADVRLLKEVASDIEMFLENHGSGRRPTFDQVSKVVAKIALIILDNIDV